MSRRKTDAKPPGPEPGPEPTPEPTPEPIPKPTQESTPAPTATPGTLQALEAENKALVAQVAQSKLEGLVREGRATPAQATGLADKIAAGVDVSSALDVLTTNEPVAGLGGKTLADPLRPGGVSSLEAFIIKKHNL